MFWKPFDTLNDWQKEEAMKMRPYDYKDWSYHFDGKILIAAAK